MTYKTDNGEELKPVKINVTVSQTLSKEVEITMYDYLTKYDDDGSIIPVFSHQDIVNSVKDQITLPSDSFSDWVLDDEAIVE